MIGQPRAGHPRDVMVSATRIDTDLQAIEHLDFDPACPCECIDDGDHPCDRTADLILQDTPCSTCGHDDGRWLCSLACWAELGEYGAGCVPCGAVHERDETLTIIGRLR